jgi:hypothetical protein
MFRLLYPVLVQVIDIAHFLQHCLTKFEAVSDGEGLHCGAEGAGYPLHSGGDGVYQ